MRRVLKTPRVYAVRVTFKTGKIVDKMLGIAFTVAQRQKYYDWFQNYRWQERHGNDLADVKFYSEKIGEN